jgi:ProP effector
MSRNNSAKTAEPKIKELATRFPAAFVFDKWEPHRPLACGIFEQLRDACPDMGRRSLKMALFFYTGRLRYREALVEQALRIDIDGHPVGVVSHEEAQHAAQRVAAEKARRASQPAGIGALKAAATMRKKDNGKNPGSTVESAMNMPAAPRRKNGSKK